MKRTPVALAILVLTLLSPARADEGMWLFSAPPREKLKATYGFDPSQAWLTHLMQASVKFDDEGSGSFVSGDGLVITNHHVGLDSLAKMSDATHNYPRDGFYAPTLADEKKCVDVELDVLMSTEDVTARVNAAVPAAALGDEAAAARRKIIAAIEKESLEKTGLRSDVDTLYQGGAYHLLRYKRYTDVRLVFAPEQQIAFYGGDPDNFEFPRYDLDICIFRVYENGQPVHPANFLKWSVKGPKEGDLVFVSGNPGKTERLFTVAELSYLRDTEWPATLNVLKRREVLIKAWGERSDENERRSRDDFYPIQNSRKAYDGMMAGLQDPAFIDQKQDEEDALRHELAAGPEGKAVLDAYRRIAAAQTVIARNYTRYSFINGTTRRMAYAFNCDSFELAQQLLRSGDERLKANGDRLPEYSDQQKEEFELGLFSEKPIYEDYEIVKLADALSDMTVHLGFDDPTVQAVLDGKAPRARAVELIHGTRVRDVAFRRQLYAGGAAAISAAHDPMIELARLVDDEARMLRKTFEAETDVKHSAHAVIAHARFAAQGARSYPDATFTLRLSYGTVKGYPEDGVPVAPITTLAGLYQRADEHHDHPPFDLPPRWADKKGVLALDTPFNFVSDCDIIGGNSGSPTVNRDNEFVGIIFDGNIESLPGDYTFDESVNRATSVDSAGILEALRKVYGVNALADELVNGHR